MSWREIEKVPLRGKNHTFSLAATRNLKNPLGKPFKKGKKMPKITRSSQNQALECFRYRKNRWFRRLHLLKLQGIKTTLREKNWREENLTIQKQKGKLHQHRPQTAFLVSLTILASNHVPCQKNSAGNRMETTLDLNLPPGELEGRQREPKGEASKSWWNWI